LKRRAKVRKDVVVGWFDWLLALHVLSALLMVGGTMVYWTILVAGWRVDRPSIAAAFFRVARPVDVLVPAASVVALALGIWLAIYVDGYEVWDPWIVAAIVLWIVYVLTGSRTGRIFARAGERARELVGRGEDAPSSELNALLRSREGLAFHTVSSVALLVILVLMIWKPGAS
jgi:uncharacterized membrane protein